MAAGEDRVLSRAGDAVRLKLRVTPNAGADALGGAQPQADGSARLKARVSAPPDKGKANAAVIRLLSKQFGVPRPQISIDSGETDRNKTVRIDAAPADIEAQVAALLLAAD